MGELGSGFKLLQQSLSLRNMLALVALMVGVVMFMPAPEAHAQACDGSDTVAGYNRERWCGFFNNEGWTSGPALRGGTWSSSPSPGGSWTDPTAANPGIPAEVDTAQEFVNMVLDDLYNGDARAVTSAQFIILSMLGVTPAPQTPLTKAVTPEQIVEWQARVLTYADISDDGSGTSTGQNGSITWFEQTHLDCGETNTYYQIDQDDVAPFLVNATNTPNCTDPNFLEDYITFRDSGGNILLQVRRICMNPAGEINALEAAAPIAEDGTLGDTIFEDKNDDGVYDPAAGDKGIEGVTVALYGVTDNTCTRNQNDLIATTVTDADGNYQFSDLPVISEFGAYARYVVVVTDDNNVLEGYEPTQGEVGVDNNSQDPNGYCMLLSFDTRSNQTGDFGYYRQEAAQAQSPSELAPTGVPAALVAGAAGALAMSGVGIAVQYRRFIRE